MANRFYNYIVTLVAGTLAKAEDVGPSNFGSIETGMTAIEGELDQAIRITNSPGTTTIALNAAARALKLLSFDVNGDLVTTTTVGSNKGNHAAAAGTPYIINDIVKDSTGSLGLNNIYIANTTHTSTGTLSTDTANWDLLVDAAASAASAAAALVSENNAAASFDAFDDRELGSKASDPTLDNDGNALLDGAQYWNTTLNRKKIYDLGTTTWLLTTANAVDVNIADAGSLYTATDVEGALQEVILRSASSLTTGTSTAYVLDAGITALASGDVYKGRIHVLSGAAPTLNINSTGVNSILLTDGVAIPANVMPVDLVAEFLWDGTDFILQNPQQYTSTYTPTLTPSTSGTLTLSASNNTLSFVVDGRMCHVSGEISMSAVTSPLGTIGVSVPITPAALTEGGERSSAEVSYNFITAVALGLTGFMLGSVFVIYEKTTTGTSSTAADKMGSSSILRLGFSYRI